MTSYGPSRSSCLDPTRRRQPPSSLAPKSRWDWEAKRERTCNNFTLCGTRVCANDDAVVKDAAHNGGARRGRLGQLRRAPKLVRALLCLQMLVP